VDEARPPRIVVRISGFVAATTRVFYQSNVGAEGSTIVCLYLVGDSPWWRSSDCHLCLQRVAALARHNDGDDNMGCSDSLLALPLLPDCGGVVSCSVCCLRVLFVCSVVSFGACSFLYFF
jgi:hypothetical protein